MARLPRPLTLVFPLALAVLAAACTAKGTAGGDEQAVAEPTFTDEDPGRSMFEWRVEPDQLTTAPVSLTADDGTGLQLTSMDAKVVLEDPLAFTELTLTFHNPEHRVREGRFEINLPQGAAISRFAMLIDGEWQEAEVVERQAARVAYEDFLHRKQDPALLEKQAGNQFSARVFPIPGKADKQIKIAYSQELRSSKQPYQLLLAGLPRMNQFDVDVAIVRAGTTSIGSSLGGQANNVEHLNIHEQEFVPRADLEVRFEREVVERGLRSDTLAVGRIAPVADASASPEPITGLTVLFDTSASRALGYDGQVDRLAALLAALAAEADFPIEVVAFDQTLESIYRGDARGFGGEAKAKLRARHALGASDLAGALTHLGSPERELHPRVLVVSDGILSAGEHGHEALAAAVTALGERGVSRLDALVDGGISDELTLAALTTAGLAHDGVVANARLTPEALTSKLTRATRSGVEVVVPGAEWVWPRTLDGVQPGDEVLIYAQLPVGTPMVVELRDPASGKVRKVGIPTRAGQGPLLERAWTRAKIDQMTAAYRALNVDAHDYGDQRSAAHAEIVALSTRERVLSDFTALLVLETNADYARFGIDRTALADILTVGPSGVALINRSNPNDRLDEDTRNGQIHRGEEGKLGQPSETSKSGLYRMKRPAADAVPAAFAIGGDDDDVWGSLTGAEVGEAYGLGDLRLVGTSRGGGGTGIDDGADEGTIGLGNVGLIGRGGGGGAGDDDDIWPGLTGTGSGYGRGSGAGFGSRGQRVSTVAHGQPEVQGNLDRDIIRRIIRAHINEVRSCYNAALTSDPTSAGRVAISFVITGKGKVGQSVVQENTTADTKLGTCIAKAVKRWTFPKPRGGGDVTVTYPFVLSTDSDTVAKPATEAPYTGRFAEIMQRLADGETELALSEAWQWRESEPGSELALLALGEAAEAAARYELASRAYGSLIDLFPSRADIRRMAGQRLERVAEAGGQSPAARAALELAIDSYREAVEQRADHPSSHRLYAYALVKAGRHEDAFTAILAGITRSYPAGRFAGVPEILREDAGLIAAAWIAAEPNDDKRVRARLAEHDLKLATTASTRFVIHWETDANDVDFHIYDANGGHAYYASKELRSGGRLYADVTTGYGPECFTIEGKPSAGPYTLQAHYFSMGPMGYGMGKLEILRHDGLGGLSFEQRPFVIMRDRAFVDLGKVKG